MELKPVSVPVDFNTDVIVKINDVPVNPIPAVEYWQVDDRFFIEDDFVCVNIEEPYWTIELQRVDQTIYTAITADFIGGRLGGHPKPRPTL